MKPQWEQQPEAIYCSIRENDKTHPKMLVAQYRGNKQFKKCYFTFDLLYVQRQRNS